MAKQPPTKAERQKCWTARDAYFKCLDDHDMWLDGLKPSSLDEILSLDVDNSTGKSIITSLDSKNLKPSKECHILRQIWENDCLSSWKHHFITERIKEKQKTYLVKKMEKEESDRIQGNDSDFWDRVRESNK